MTQQWTPDDLPSLPDVLGEVTTHECGEGAAAYRTAALAHLNAHHPKPSEETYVRVLDQAAEINDLKAERDEWKARALDAEHYAQAMSANNRDNADRASKAERERDEALRKKGEAFDRAVRAEREVTTLRTAGAVSRADVERLVHRYIDGGFDELHASRVKSTTDAFMALLSGSDPAVHVVRESDIAAVEVERGSEGGWGTESIAFEPGRTVEEVRDWVGIHIRSVAECEAIARHIEAEQAEDPAEEQTDALADILYGDELVTDQMRGVLERVVRAGMLFPDEEATR